MLRSSWFIGLLAAAVFSVSVAGAKDAGSWTGKWVLDRSASAPPDAPQGLEQRIRQNGSNYIIESRFKEPVNGIAPLLYLGIMTTSLQLNGSGGDAQNQIGPFAQRSKTTVDGNRMVTDWTAEVNGDQVTGQWVRTLASDGRRMTLDIKESSKGQSKQATLTFVRK